jgi:hypothetical protein
MLAALSDGREHSRRELLEASGEFYLTNNASAELRARGFNVVHRRKGGVDTYQLLGSLDTAPVPDPSLLAGAVSSEPASAALPVGGPAAADALTSPDVDSLPVHPGQLCMEVAA